MGRSVTIFISVSATCLPAGLVAGGLGGLLWLYTLALQGRGYLSLLQALSTAIRYNQIYIKSMS